MIVQFRIVCVLCTYVLISLQSIGESATRVFFCAKQKTAYELRISDWSSDVCSSDLADLHCPSADDDPALRQDLPHAGRSRAGEIGRASCRARVCQYVSISVGAVSLKKQDRDESCLDVCMLDQQTNTREYR